jgi:P27 family predicted phage terminase small subunit
MGIRGPLAKRSTLTVVPIQRVPRTPSTLGKEGQDAWAMVWAECGRWLTSSDIAAVERLAILRDEEAELRALVKETGRTTRGSQGQLVDHPYVGQLRGVEASMLRLEQLLGIGPLHRARLGVAVAKAAAETTHADALLEKYRGLAQEGR